VYGSAKNGWMSLDWKVETTGCSALLDTIVEHIPALFMKKALPRCKLPRWITALMWAVLPLGAFREGLLQVGHECFAGETRWQHNQIYH
jgi:GTP-binding protein